MRKTKNKSKYSKFDKYYIRKLWEAGFLLVLFIGLLPFSLLNLTGFPNNSSLIILIFFQIFLLGGATGEFYTAYSKLKGHKNSTDFKKKALKFEKDLNIYVNELMKNIKIVEGKVRELEDMYILLEKDELLKIKLENQKEKHQFQNYKFKLDNLKDSLHEIKKNYEESIKSELKILWTTKPRKLKRRIKRVAKDILHINTQCENIKLQLKKDFE